MIALLLTVAFLQDSDYDRWVRQLGDPEYEVREGAAMKLQRAAAAAIPALEKGAASDDLEIRSRAKELLASIRLAGPKAGVWRDAPEITLNGSYVARDLFRTLSLKAGVPIDADAVDPAAKFDRDVDRWPLLRVLDEFCGIHTMYTWAQDESGAVKIEAGKTASVPYAYAGPLRLRSKVTEFKTGWRVACEAAFDRSCVPTGAVWRLALLEAATRDGLELRESPPAEAEIFKMGGEAFTRRPADVLALDGDPTGGLIKARARVLAPLKNERREIALEGREGAVALDTFSLAWSRDAESLAFSVTWGGDELVERRILMESVALDDVKPVKRTSGWSVKTTRDGKRLVRYEYQFEFKGMNAMDAQKVSFTWMKEIVERSFDVILRP